VSLTTLHREIVACTRCARLRAHCLDVAAVKRAAYRGEREVLGRAAELLR